MASKQPDIGAIRTAYKLARLDESDLEADPMVQFRKWFNEALEKGVMEPNAMTLATSSPNGIPSARIVLLKDLDDTGFGFFTNYESRKGIELENNPVAALLFFWPELQRQVRVVGSVVRMTGQQSDAYFDSRPEGSRLGAIASPQSREIADKTVVEERLATLERLYSGGAKIPRPPHWGGYRVHPGSIEFWQGGDNRLHDRFMYSRAGAGWKCVRLAP